MRDGIKRRGLDRIYLCHNLGKGDVTCCFWLFVATPGEWEICNDDLHNAKGLESGITRSIIHKYKLQQTNAYIHSKIGK
jgi:hypothetical protein